MEEKPTGERDAQTQPEIILSSPSTRNTEPAPNRICPNCGTSNPPGSVYCYKCGQKLPDAALQDKKICVGCGTPNSASSQYCYKCGLQLSDKLGAGHEMRYGGFWIRLGAYLIDAILLGIVTSIISVPLLTHYLGNTSDLSWLSSLESTGTLPSWFWTYYLLTLLFNIVIQVLYYSIAVGKWSKTIGKAALKLRVVKPDGSRVSYWRALGRSLAYFLNSFTFGLTFLIIAFTHKKRGLHDYIADTIVIKTD